jgi:hypothetical protein
MTWENYAANFLLGMLFGMLVGGIAIITHWRKREKDKD